MKSREVPCQRYTEQMGPSRHGKGCERVSGLIYTCILASQVLVRFNGGRTRNWYSYIITVRP